MGGGDGPDIGGADRMKVFVSYSRDDVAFADQLVVALEDRGFDPVLDRHDVHAAENWKQRLGGLILSSDAVVFVLTEQSAGSPICAWEVEEAQRLGKRIIPVVPGELSAAPPQALADLNWIHFYATPAIPGSGMFDGVRKLERALRVDLSWLRQQTVLQEQAARWSGRERTADSPHLLRGTILQEAQDWAQRAPAGAVVPIDVREFIEASAANEGRLKAEAQAGIAEREKALAAAETAQKRLKLYGRIALIAGAVLLALAIPLNYFAVTRTLEANDLRSAQFAAAAQQLAAGGDHAAAMLMAIAGDPDANAGVLESALRPDGNLAARDALTHAYTHNRLIQRTDTSTDTEITTAALSPDGTKVLAGYAHGGAVYVIDGTAPPVELEQTPLLGVNAKASAFSPDGSRIAIGFEFGGGAAIWSASSGKLIAILAAGGDSGTSINAVAFSPDGQSVFIGGDKGTAELKSASDGATLKRFATGTEVVEAAFSRDGSKLAIAVYGATEIWPAAGGEPEVLRHGFSETESLTFFPIGDYNKLLVRGAADGIVELVSSPGGMVLETYPGPAGPALVAFAPDGRTLLTGAQDGSARLWMANGTISSSQPTPLAVYRAGGGRVVSVGYAPDGTALLVTSDGVVTRWETAGAVELTGSERKQPKRIADVSTGHGVSATVNNNLVAVWRGDGDQPFATIDVQPALVRNAVVSPDGKTLATTQFEGPMKLWSVEGKLLHTFEAEGSLPVEVAFSPDGKTVAASFMYGSLQGKHGAVVWPAAGGEPLARLSPGSPVLGFAYSADGKRIVTASITLELRLWSAEDGEEVGSFALSRAANEVWLVSLEFSPDGKSLLGVFGPSPASSDDASLMLVWPATGGQPVATLTLDRTLLSAAAFSPDGQLIVADYGTGVAGIWSIRGGPALQTFDAFSETELQVLSLAFGKDSATLFVESEDGTLQQWPIDPFVRARPREQVATACATLTEIGVTKFTEEHYRSFPILDRNAPQPCAKM